MSKLFQLKQFYSLEGTAKRLSTTFEEEVELKDVIQLIIEEQLSVSLYLQNQHAELITRQESPTRIQLEGPFRVNLQKSPAVKDFLQSLITNHLGLKGADYSDKTDVVIEDDNNDMYVLQDYHPPTTSVLKSDRDKLLEAHENEREELRSELKKRHYELLSGITPTPENIEQLQRSYEEKLDSQACGGISDQTIQHQSYYLPSMERPLLSQLVIKRADLAELENRLEEKPIGEEIESELGSRKEQTYKEIISGFCQLLSKENNKYSKNGLPFVGYDRAGGAAGIVESLSGYCKLKSSTLEQYLSKSIRSID